MVISKLSYLEQILAMDKQLQENIMQEFPEDQLEAIEQYEEFIR